MKIQTESESDWKNKKRMYMQNVNMSRSTFDPGNEGLISMLPASNSIEETRPGATPYITTAVETLLLKRTQMLQ